MADSLMHTTCLLCGKHAVSVPWHLEGLPYKNYSYCSDCISKGIKLLKAKGQTYGDWVSVKDRLPKDGQDVLAYLNDGEETRIAPCHYYNGVWFDSVMNCIVAFLDVTHWMPLPEPPKEDT